VEEAGNILDLADREEADATKKSTGADPLGFIWNAPLAIQQAS
jgi:hypothetical protein